MAKKMINIISIILILVIITVSLKILSRKQEQEEARSLYNELRQTKDIITQDIQIEDTQTNPHKPEVQPSWLETLQEKNPDTVGWMNIPDTAVQYPVMQAIDNEYYLQHSFKQEENSAGSIYVDYRNSPLFTDQNTVIYGHDMKNGSMFHNLRYMRKQEYVTEHPTIFVALGEEILEYEIFSVYPTEANYDYRTPNYKEIEQYEDFLKRIQKKSIIDSPIIPNKEDKILTLSTCTYDFEDARLAVHARLKR